MSWEIVLKKDTYPRSRDVESYMLKHSVWRDEAGLDWKDGNPSIDDIEKRIGRRLTKNDFILYAPATWSNPSNKPTVMSRIGKEGILEGINHFLEDPTAVIGRIPPEFRQDKSKEDYTQKVKEALTQIGENPETYLQEKL